MDTTEKYIKMCYKARKDMFPLWLGVTKLSKIGTFIQWRSFMGMISLTNKDRDESGMMGFIPETLAIRTWCKNELDLTFIVTKNYWIEEKNKCEWADNEGTPLYRQDQLQDMSKHHKCSICHSGNITVFINQFINIWADSKKYGYRDFLPLMEQLWLMLVMKEKFDKIWNDKTEEWEDVK